MSNNASKEGIIIYYYCPIKLFFEGIKKIGLNPFAGFSPCGYICSTTNKIITMGKSIHSIGQPLYSHVINLLDKAKILHISREQGGEHYTKRFFVWVHLVVMLYAVIKRFDSLREITTSLLVDTHKLTHIGITFKIGRSTLADANKHRSESIF